MILPNTTFLCNGTITGYTISLNRFGNGNLYPTIQLWRPTSTTTYDRISLYQLVSGNIPSINNGDYYLANVFLTGDDRVEFQSGDIIGYTLQQHGNNYYTVWNIHRDEYISYTTTFDGSNIPETFAITDNTKSYHLQPLIKVIFGEILW